MKKFKISLLALLSLFTLTMSFSACSDDDDSKDENETENTVKCIEEKFIDFKMYVGSADGAKEVSTEGLNPRDYIKNEDGEISTGYLSLTFYKKDNVTINGVWGNPAKSIDTKYKQENEILHFYDLKSNSWYVFGYGTTKKFIRKAGEYKYTSRNENGSGSSLGSSENGYLDLNSALIDAEISSLAMMKNEGDTIMWCNVDYFFE